MNEVSWRLLNKWGDVQERSFFREGGVWRMWHPRVYKKNPEIQAKIDSSSVKRPAKFALVR